MKNHMKPHDQIWINLLLALVIITPSLFIASLNAAAPPVPPGTTYNADVFLRGWTAYFTGTGEKTGTWKVPNGNPDRLHPGDTTTGRRYTDVGFADASADDGSLIKIPAGKNYAEIEGRKGIGTIYEVKGETRFTQGGTGKIVNAKWTGKAEDSKKPETLVIEDRNGVGVESDSDNTFDDTPLLYCGVADNADRGDVDFYLIQDEDGPVPAAETYDWEITKGTAAEASGKLTYNAGNKRWEGTYPNLDIGYTYSLLVTKEGNQDFKRKIDFRVVSIRLYLGEDPDGEIDGACNFTNELTDYPKTETHSRSPKYMFRRSDVIFVEVRGIDPAGVDLNEYLSVYSATEEENKYIPLKETGTDTGIYRNVISGWTDGALRLTHKGANDTDLRISVKDEEVLYFHIKKTGDGHSPALKDIMVDRAEVGAAGLEYKDLDGYDRLYSTVTCAEDFIKYLKNPLGNATITSFTPVYDAHSDTTCKKEDFTSVKDSSRADAADIVSWSGHGTNIGGSKYYCIFLKGDEDEVDKLYQDNVGLGNTDAEWAIFNSCRFLNTSTEAEDGDNGPGVKQEDIDAELKKICKNGLHIVCGFKTRMNMGYSPSISKEFIDELNSGSTIVEAWKETARKCTKKNAGEITIGRIFGLKTSLSQSFVPDNDNGIYPIRIVSRDPNSTDKYEVLGTTRVQNP